ncbi:hypothetical protein ACSLBF_11745 [Pseudoalteromonas sp. T1lg65]|uniref:hypothetical protein n=1 Tax=Pseudoalteromonas sp. T1lg65 TaxID=2077101 RepID=UPI003F7AEDED
MYFRLSQIDKLSHLKLRDKQMVLAIALGKLNPKHKILLRIFKLALLTPFFASLVIFEGWILLPILVIAGLIYPLFTTPIEIQFAISRLDEAIEEHNKIKNELLKQ